MVFVAAPPAHAHVGSPDVFFDGKIGTYPAQITIRVPPVVPGLAQIEVRAQTTDPLTVSFLPLYSKIAVKNAPPADVARPSRDEPGVYTGELWLMRTGGYSIEVRAAGPAGAGAVQVPVNAVATHQLAMPPFLGNLLLSLGGVLVFGLGAIVYAAAGESVLPLGATMAPRDRRRGFVAGAITAVVVAGALLGGWLWWQADEQEFRRKLREGAWPDLLATVDTAASDGVTTAVPERGNDSPGGRASHEEPARVLHLAIGEKTFSPDAGVPLLRDHGKLLHTFLIREPQRDVFAHVHPVRRGGKYFDLALPPLPAGDYRVLCDMTFSDSGVSSTAMTTVHIPGGAGAKSQEPRAKSSPAESASPSPLRADPDDSWAVAVPIREATGNTDTVFPLPGGRELHWAAHPPLRAKHNAHLQFTVRDATGQPVPLEPYMGMMSHAAIMRADGRVFAHLHPTGNYSMAAQMFFDAKITREAAAPSAEIVNAIKGVPIPPDTVNAPAPGATANAGAIDAMPAMDHAHMHHGPAPGETISSITLPYEFPTPGDYQIWVQIKTAGEVLTGSFLAHVAE